MKELSLSLEREMLRGADGLEGHSSTPPGLSTSQYPQGNQFTVKKKGPLMYWKLTGQNSYLWITITCEICISQQ